MTRSTKDKTESELIWESTPFHSLNKVNRIKLSSELTKLKKSVKKDIDSHLSIYLEILDECIRVLIHIERLEPSEKSSWGFWVFKMLTSRMRSLYLSFRELTFIGQTDPMRLIARSSMESLELAVASIISTEFCEGFASTEETDEDVDKKFWSENIGYGKIYKYLETAFPQFKIFEGQDLIDHISWRKSWKTALSSSVHSSFGIAFQCSFTPSLSSPGQFVIEQLGHLNEQTPALFGLLITEVHMFGAFVLNMTTSNNRPEQWPNFKPSEVTDLMAAYFTLNAMYQKYEHVFENDSNKLHRTSSEDSD